MGALAQILAEKLVRISKNVNSMREYELLLKGFILGFSIAAPVGPIGVLCIRRTLASGRWHGFFTGLGAATADAFYGSIAAFGLTAVSSFLLRYKIEIRMIGGIFLLYLGIKIFRSKVSNTTNLKTESSLMGAYASSVFLTLTNPVTILSFVAVFAGLGLGTLSRANYWTAALLILGVFMGSVLWWILLSTGVSSFKSLSTPQRLAWVNLLSAFLIASFGITSIIMAFR